MEILIDPSLETTVVVYIWNNACQGPGDPEVTMAFMTSMTWTIWGTPHRNPIDFG